MSARRLCSRIPFTVGAVAMLVGAIDPMEGSLLILPGSGLVALGTLLERGERRLARYRVWVFVLVALGVGASWGLTMAGNMGGACEVPHWWAVLILLYPIGWSLGIWGPGSPRWMLWSGIAVGVWYLGLLLLALTAGRHISVNIITATVGLATIAGCVNRLRKSPSRREHE